MGQAKKRGNFEQRQQAAYDRIESTTELHQKAHENIMEMERLERESAAMMSNNAAQFVKAWWEHSGIENRIARRTALDLVLDGAR